MKRITPGLLILAATVFAIPALAAPPIFQEDFNYAIGSQLNGQGGWSAHSGAGTNPQTINTAGGLSYAGYPSSGLGNLLGPLATSGEDNNHTFPGQTTGAVYTALMVNVASSQTTGDYFFHYFDGAISGNIFRGRIFVKKDASSSNYAFGIQFGSTINTVYTGFVYTTGVTHLLVLKYTFVAGGTTNDQVSLFVDPTGGCIEPAATVSASDGTQTDAVNLDGVAIRQGTATAAASVQVDGIRVATNWSDAVCGDATPTHSSTWGRLKTLYH
ncbi:MAG TPA: hypothetical protein VL123_05510 [Candidatus Udaeobacter sp.]|jgi:hypothetical protein|nr:hypothetical protein [Candidatus Udaeobacter sp.]